MSDFSYEDFYDDVDIDEDIGDYSGNITNTDRAKFELDTNQFYGIRERDKLNAQGELIGFTYQAQVPRGATYSKGGRFGHNLDNSAKTRMLRVLKACVIENYNRLIGDNPGTPLTGTMLESLRQGTLEGNLVDGTISFVPRQLNRIRPRGGFVSTWYYLPIVFQGRGIINSGGLMKFQGNDPGLGSWHKAVIVDAAPAKDVFNLSDYQVELISRAVVEGMSDDVNMYLRENR